MALLGEDGRGYELAKKLEACGVWRSWLGDSNYATLVPFLSSPSSWESFMRTDDSRTRAQIQLQLRARALLYDKASVSLFLRSNSSSSSSSSSVVVATASKLNPFYLQLHGDDVYYSLEDCSQDGVLPQEISSSTSTTSIQSKIHSKSTFTVGLRYGESDVDNTSKRLRHEELPETWYNQFIEKYRSSMQHKFPFGDRELHNRTPEEMSAYLRLVDVHKRRRLAFKVDPYMGFGNPILENGPNLHPDSVSDGNSFTEDETSFFPEIMFPSNCVPDSALPSRRREENRQKVEFYEVLDSLPQVMTRSPAMIERFGIRPEYLRMGLGRSKYRGKSRKSLSKEQASQVSQKVIARALASVGFEGATKVTVDVFSQFLSCHISKLGCILKVLSDSYRKQCSALELLKMFIQTAGFGNLGALMEHVKDGTRNSLHQNQQHLQGLQSGFQSQHHSALLQAQQIPRQMHPQMQMVHPQMTFQQQQQWERMRRRQLSIPNSGITLDKDRPTVEVKIENPSETPMNGNTFGTVTNRHNQMQVRQQKMAVMANLHAQSNHQFKQLASLQNPQLQSPNTVTVRAPPVKVEGFQELMGGDATSKHDSEERKLTSPSK